MVSSFLGVALRKATERFRRAVVQNRYVDGISLSFFSMRGTRLR